MIKRVIVFQPDAEVTLERWEAWLAQRHIAVEICELWHQPPLSPAVLSKLAPQTEASLGIVVLGGRMSAHAQTEHPWIEPLKTLLQAAIAHNIPVLGICLGHQLLAEALGGQVQVAAEKSSAPSSEPSPAPSNAQSSAPSSESEDGPVLISLTSNGLIDPFSRRLPTQMHVLQSHHDWVSQLPAQSDLLASSAQCAVQMLRCGSAVSVQFHPEASPDTLYRWSRNEEGEEAAQQLRAAAQAVDAQVAASGTALLDAWLAADWLPQKEN